MLNNFKKQLEAHLEETLKDVKESNYNLEKHAPLKEFLAETNLRLIVSVMSIENLKETNPEIFI